MTIDPMARRDLQRVATHVLARRRHAVTGRFGLRPAPGGCATPAFGDEVEVVRLAGGALVHERGGRSRATPLEGATLADLAEAVGVQLGEHFSAGHDTPALGDLRAPLRIGDAATVAGAWWTSGARAIDAVLLGAGPGADPSVAQLWPEHFDLGIDLAWGPGEGERVGFGVSPGDDAIGEPYLYVGPWGPHRPGDAGYWNAAFGAAVRQDELTATNDPHAAATAFFRRGLDLLRTG